MTQKAVGLLVGIVWGSKILGFLKKGEWIFPHEIE